MSHAWADIDNDGDLDAYFAATWNQTGINELWLNDGTGTMTINQNSGAPLPIRRSLMKAPSVGATMIMMVM